MATSRSSEPWTAEVRVFSGRRAPRWALDAPLAQRLEALWEQLPALPGRTPAPPALGYRGVQACDPSGRCWDAYRGVVTSSGAARRDADRAFERLVIDSAPAGALPPQIRELAGLAVPSRPTE
jgi:hypothetical protein